jgi:hypothetical protein
MILISHRGNITGRIPDSENRPSYIQDTITLGYDVEIDVRIKEGELYLGHDYAQYRVELGWLLERRGKLWIHTKDFESLDLLVDKGLRIFFHEQERQTIINNTNLIWSHDLESVSSKSIIPLLDLESIDEYGHLAQNVYGVCSDYLHEVKALL